MGYLILLTILVSVYYSIAWYFRMRDNVRLRNMKAYYETNRQRPYIYYPCNK